MKDITSKQKHLDEHKPREQDARWENNSDKNSSTMGDWDEAFKRSSKAKPRGKRPPVLARIIQVE